MGTVFFLALLIGGGLIYMKTYQPKQYAAIINTVRGVVQDIKNGTSTQSGDKISIQVSTTPKGATILVDGASLAKKTPTKVTLPPGDYEVQLTLEGYKPVTRKVTVEKDTPLSISETLEK
jgi:hypothetical protein